MAGLSNDQPAFINLKTVSGSTQLGVNTFYYPNVSFQVYWPAAPKGVPRNGVEVDLAYYNHGGRMFARTRLSDPGAFAPWSTVTGLGDFPLSAIGPPFRIVVTLRLTSNPNLGYAIDRCNDDHSTFGEGTCRASPLPPSTASVVFQYVTELTVP